MASYVELYVDQGATFSSTITLVDDVTNLPINVALYNVRSSMKRSYYSANASANLVCTIVDGANGLVSLSLANTVTSNIRAGRYVFDVTTRDNNNIVSRVIEGTITVTPGVTR
jgi:hypothetical protein